jgi:hypothetical protein
MQILKESVMDQIIADPKGNYRMVQKMTDQQTGHGSEH